MKRITLAAAGLLLAAAPAASAQDAEAWVQKIQKNAGKPVEAGMITKVDAEGMKVNATGNVSYGDAKHFLMDMKMEMSMPAMGITDPMSMTMKMIGDGTTVWMEMDNPMMGGLQVMKFPIDMMDQMAGMGMNMSMSGSSEIDPIKQMAELASMVNFESVNTAGGRVTMKGMLNEKGLESMAQPASMMGVELNSVMLVIDEKTGFPLEVNIGDGKKTVMTSQYTNPKFLKEINLATYAYTPPEGVEVMDMAAMMGGASMGEGSEF